MTTATALLSLALVSAATSAGVNLLQNASFETVGPNGNTVSYTGQFAGPSAADQWEVFHNTSGTTRTRIVPTTLPAAPSGSSMIQVLTTGLNNGLGQVFIPGGFGNGPASGEFAVWVYVVRGTVGIGIGNGGNTSLTAFSTIHEQWQLVTGVNAPTQSPVNTIAIYASSVDGAEFYVDEAVVTPAPAGAALLGAVALGAGRRRR